MRDPVCGMTVGPDAATVVRHPEFGFCSEHCLQEFNADPEKYFVVFDTFGVSADLPEGENVPVEFTPSQPGEYEFACQMGMLRGKVVVS